MTDHRIDNVTLERAMKLHPAIRPLVIDILSICIDNKVPIRIVQGLRTFEEQEAIYAKGRTVPGKIVSKARGGDSWHNYGLAFDFCLLRGEKSISWKRDEDLDADGKKDWEEVVALFMAKGFEWGGNWTSFPDYPHIQKIFGLTIKKAKEMHASGKIDSNGYLII